MTVNPYTTALEPLEQWAKDGDLEALQEYVFRRFTGREAEPPFDAARGGERPEDFLVWAFADGNAPVSEPLAECLGPLFEEHWEHFRQGRPGEADLLSRLLFLAVQFRSKPVARSLQQRLVTQGDLNTEPVSDLRNASPIPYGESLLHQALSALGYLETGLPDAEQEAREPFWTPIVEGEVAELPASTRVIALQALARRDWQRALVDHMKGYAGALLDEVPVHGERAAVRELAKVLYFFVEESDRQEAEAEMAPRPTLLEDPDPIAQAFRPVVQNRPQDSPLRLLRQALRHLASSPAVFRDRDPSLQNKWSGDAYVAVIVEEARVHAGGVRERLRMKEAAAEHVGYDRLRVIRGAA